MPGRGPIEGSTSSPKRAPGAGWGSPSDSQDTTAVYSSKSAECEYVTMTLSAKMQAQQLIFFFGTNESTDAGPFPTSYKLRVIVSTYINEPSYPVPW